MHSRLDEGDLLLVYGFGVPLLMVVVWVAALAVAWRPWLVIPIAGLVGAVVLARACVLAARNSPGPRRRPPR
jgi:hypothetical protein